MDWMTYELNYSGTCAYTFTISKGTVYIFDIVLHDFIDILGTEYDQNEGRTVF